MSAIESLFPTVNSADVRIKGSVRPPARPVPAKPVQKPPKPQKSQTATRKGQPAEQQARPAANKKENRVVNAYRLYSPTKKTNVAPVLGKNIDIKA